MAVKGRPSKIVRAEIIETIMERVSAGETLKKVCETSGFPSASTFRGWIGKDDELSERWARVKELKAHSIFDEAIGIARELNAGYWIEDQKRYRPWGHLEANIVRAKQVAIETLLKAAAKLSPKEYGDKIDKATIIPIKIETNLNLGQPGYRSVVDEDIYAVRPKTITLEDFRVVRDE